MLDFILYILHRAFSGVKNGAGYASNLRVCAIGAGLTALVPIIAHPSVEAVLIGVFPCLIFYAFLKNKMTWIHSLEFATTWAFPLMMIFNGSDVIAPVLAYPLGNALMKGFVNLGTNRPFIDVREITNDATGRTVNFFLFGREFHIPRLNNGWIRLALGINLAFLYVALHYILGLEISIFK